MKKLKSAFLGTALAGTIIIGAGMVGTYSWFTSETTTKGTLINGSFSLGEMEELFDHHTFAPSQLLFSNWQSIHNTGDMDQLLRASYTHEVDVENIDLNQYKVGYTALKYKEKPDEDELNDQIYELEQLLNGTTNPIEPLKDDAHIKTGILTKEELQTLQDSENGDGTFILGDADEFWSLQPDEYIEIVFGVKLDEHAGNEFQGITYNATFKVEAKQTDEGATYDNL